MEILSKWNINFKPTVLWEIVGNAIWFFGFGFFAFNKSDLTVFICKSDYFGKIQIIPKSINGKNRFRDGLSVDYKEKRPAIKVFVFHFHGRINNKDTRETLKR